MYKIQATTVNVRIDKTNIQLIKIKEKRAMFDDEIDGNYQTKKRKALKRKKHSRRRL